MRSIFSLGLLASALVLPGPAMAQAAGAWRVTGDVDGKAFTVDCRFTEKDGQLAGACVDVAADDANGKPGKRHILSQGSIRGQDISWSYATKVLFMTIDIEFAGRMGGKRIAGTVSAKGRAGHFTAIPL